MVQRATGTRPAPRRRGRPRKKRTREEEEALAAQRAAKKQRTRLQDNDRRRIVTKHQEGKTPKDIAKDLMLNASSVRTVITRWKKTGLVYQLTKK